MKNSKTGRLVLIAIGNSIFAITSFGQATCATAVSITSGTSCTNTIGTMVGSTNDGTSTSCGTGRYDVWYRFTAEASISTITMSGIGANFTNPRLQLFSGGCGALTSIFCSTT